MGKIYSLRVILLLLLLAGCGSEIPRPENPDKEPLYEKITLSGFTLHVESELLSDPEVVDPYNYLKRSLNDLSVLLPEGVLTKLRFTPIWIVSNSEEPVVKIDLDITLCEDSCLFINNFTDFYNTSVTNQPALLLHHFARLYYLRHLRSDHDFITTLYQEAMAAGMYDNVDYFNGEHVEKRAAEAGESVIQYFAELSEAYLAKNDYFPFDYHDLLSFDTDGFALMEQVWGERGLKQYTRYRVQGFDVMVHNDNLHNSQLAEALSLLDEKLLEIVTLVPDRFTALMKRSRLWLEAGDGSAGGSAAFYHPYSEWLLQNNYLIEKYRCVEIANMANFISWCKGNQPMMVLHELAHLYHDQTYGFDYPRIRSVYDDAQKSGRYNSVNYRTMSGEIVSGQRAYAMTNHHEYFAELSEAWFGENDYFPFNREDLREFDPAGYELMRFIWDPSNFRE